MKKVGRMLAMAIAMLLVLGGVTALAAGSFEMSGECGENLTWELIKNGDENYTLQIKGSGAMYDDFRFHELNGTDNGFIFTSKYIKSLILPQGLTAISDYAFSEVLGGGNVVVPSSVKTIGEYAFVNSIISSVKLNEGLTSIGESAFAFGNSCAVVIPKSVKQIGDYAFYNRAPWVYQGSYAEQYCQENELDYRVVDTGSSSFNSEFELAAAIGSANDVPPRYRVPAINAIGELNLTTAQISTLTNYINSEKTHLAEAMADDKLDYTEISSFVSSFKSVMNDVGITVSTNIKIINGYPGVELTATVNGQEKRLNVYRTGYRWAYSWHQATTETTATELSLSPKDLTLALGESRTISVNLNPNDPAANVVWAFYSRDVFRVDEMSNTSVTITAIRPGYGELEAYVNTSEYSEELSDTCNITVPDLREPSPDGGVAPKKLERIEAETFAGTRFKQIYIPDGATAIGSGAFKNCNQLCYIWIPDSVTSIASNAFDGCTNVTVFCGENSAASKVLMGKDNINLVFVSQGYFEEDDWDD